MKGFCAIWVDGYVLDGSEYLPRVFVFFSEFFFFFFGDNGLGLVTP